ncbi:MAG TPA: hypothetical protein VE934_11945 [Polaromonas sp.]|uniref:hypothetical protein n=1 Tax=Polaromonas sp. TaxID=1869339 RepID=UPI002D699EA9|nr:hypothetical protein [Polaromonas sp.]HYW57667.1 hypothetical protein [Polaromonas sp.]
MDLLGHITGAAPLGAVNPGATTPAPYNVAHTGAVDGTGPASATKNMAEIYNRDLLWRRAMISTAGLVFDPTNWVQELAAIQLLIAAGAFLPGRILQQAITTDAGSSTTSTSLVNLSIATQSITPKSSNSKIIVECIFLGTIAPLAANNVNAAFGLYDNTNAVLVGATATIGAANGSGGTGIHTQQTLKTSVNNAALAIRQFSLRGQTGNAGASASAGSCVWVLTEVQN